MKDAMQEYQAALADFSQPGARWSNTGRLTYWGKAAGLDAYAIIEDVRAAGVRDRNADIRRCWNSATPQGDAPRDCHIVRRPRPTPPRTFPHVVRDLIEAGGGEADADAVRGLSPYWYPRTANATLAQTAAFLRLFDPGDLLFIHKEAEKAAPPDYKVNLLPAGEWPDCLHGLGDRCLVNPNPYTGEEGVTTEGRPSFTAQSCLARFPFIIVEFDDMPLSKQCAFWRGLLTKSPLAATVATVTYSGGKSLHGLLYVGCATLAEWAERRDQLRRLLAADEDKAFRADEQSMRPGQATRLPGVVRFDSGRLQELLYLNPGTVSRGARVPAQNGDEVPF